MVLYNPKDWFKLIFQFHKSDTFRILLPALIGMGLYTALLAYLESAFFNTKHEDPTKVHNILGFVLSMLLVFRINTAYDRWYEGRRLWGGFVNSSRNLALKLNSILPESHKEVKENFRILITNYVFATKEHLRGKYNQEELERTNLYTDGEIIQSAHKPNFIAVQLYAQIMKLQKENVIDSTILLMMNEELKSFTDLCGSCERIKNTPIPYSYSLFLKKIIFLYVFTLPLGYVISYSYWAIPVSILVFYAFASIELISEEIEDPFGTDANDLPIDDICTTIKVNLKEIFR